MTPPILEVRQLTKRYRSHTAVDGIGFAIPAGTCFGLLGPNGAGKTTTIEMIEGTTTPTAGDILYRGAPRTRRFREECGIQFQSTALMDYLSVREVLTLFSRLYRRSVPLPQLAEDCQLGDFLDHRATRISGGQRQRLLLALALVNDPAIVFLDEPTTGLDPQSRRQFWTLIDRIRAAGKTVILTTHYMDEAQALCDDLAIMDRGRIVDRGSPQALLKKHFQHVRVCIDRNAFGIDPALLGEPVVESATDIEILSRSIDHTIDTLRRLQVPLSTLRVRNPTLDDLFLKLTGHSLQEDDGA